MKLSFPKFKSPGIKSHKHVFLGELPDMDLLRGGEIGVITGELIIMNIDEPPQDIEGHYVSQIVRESARKDFSLKALKETSTQIHSAIHSGIARHINTHHKRTRFILAMDAMLALAATYKTNDTLLICNGFEAETKTYFDTYLFHHGQLIRITEAIIRQVNHARYAADVREQIEDALIEYPTARIIWTPPLTPFNIDNLTFEYAGMEIYNGKFPAITHNGEIAPPSPKIPIIATATTLIACIGWGAYNLSTMQDKVALYDRLTRDNDTPSMNLEILQHRAAWQKTINTNTINSFTNAQKLIAAIAQNPEWRLTNLSINTHRPDEENAILSNGSNGSNAQSNLSIILTTPNNPNVSTHEQANTIVTQLNQQTGLKLIVDRQGLSVQEQRLRLIIQAT